MTGGRPLLLGVAGGLLAAAGLLAFTIATRKCSADTNLEVGVRAGAPVNDRNLLDLT